MFVLLTSIPIREFTEHHRFIHIGIQREMDRHSTQYTIANAVSRHTCAAATQTHTQKHTHTRQ